ncbi:MAG: GGDEF domain-containing protein [Ardenticatenales bacterium]|nr:GGDEF domain-containing protein [Ardenticatenales bacterium]
MISTASPSSRQQNVPMAQSRQGLAWALLAIALLAAFVLPTAFPALILLPLLAAILAFPVMPKGSLQRFVGAAWFSSLLVVILAWVKEPLIGPILPRPESWLVAALLLLLSLFFALLARWSGVNEQLALTRTTQESLEREAGERQAALQRLLTDVEQRAATQSSLLSEVKQRTHELGLLNEMGELFHAYRTVEEAYDSVVRLTAQLFPDDGGALCLTTDTPHQIQTVAMWGKNAVEAAFDEDDCWALRNGKEHLVSQSNPGAPCRHLKAPIPVEHLCLPLKTQGRTLGVFHLAPPTSGSFTEGKLRLARLAAEQVALVLANLQLQENLRSQSVNDPLTGLYNRRYMEESLKREVRRVSRSQKPLGLIVLDIDHLQRFNDAMGYESGDTLLRELSAFFQANTRGGDIACRYSGEEFVIVLSEAPIEVVRARADLFRDALKQFKAQRGAGPNAVTLSIGVANFPQDGVSAEALLREATRAMARAKEAGGNQVVIAT